MRRAGRTEMRLAPAPFFLPSLAIPKAMRRSGVNWLVTLQHRRVIRTAGVGSTLRGPATASCTQPRWTTVD